MKSLGLPKKISVLILLFSIYNYAFSQEKLGIANSNYHPTSSIFLNPSSSVDSRTFAQLNLVGLNAFMVTNQMYLPRFSVPSLITGYNEQPVIIDNKVKKYLYSNVTLDAPALVISHSRVGFGLFARGRAEVDMRKVPYQLTQPFLPGGVLPDHAPAAAELNSRNAKISTMSWAEYGLNFAMMAKKRNGLLITAGGNLKYLTGIDLFYANMTRINGYIKDTLIDISDLRGKVRSSKLGWATGKGFGTDLGITIRKALHSDTEYEGYYVHSPRSHCDCYDYLYKLGISLLDLGYINFNEETYKASLKGNTYIPNYHNVDNTDSLIQADFDTTIERNVPIKATLPTALSVQLDMNTTHHTYLNVTLVKNVIPSSMTGVQRANLLAVAPRYETKWIEVAMPLTFHRFYYPHLGFAFRLRSFVLGSDNIIPFFMKKNTRVVSLYFNLGISLFRNPACKTKHHRKKKEKPRAKPSMDCPKFGKRNKLGF
jgi:hypothetical protein